MRLSEIVNQITPKLVLRGCPGGTSSMPGRSQSWLPCCVEGTTRGGQRRLDVFSSLQSTRHRLAVWPPFKAIGPAT
eukprot:scaffold552045_cov50-Prasinocladus_malaysianus.AAC.1